MRVLEQNHDDQALYAMSGRWAEAEKLRTISVELVDLLQLHIRSSVEAHNTVGDVQQLFDIMFILRNTLKENLERFDSSKKKNERSQYTFYDESLADSEDSQDVHSSEDSDDLVCDSYPQPSHQSVTKPKSCELRSRTLWKVGDRVEMRCRVSWKWRPGTVTYASLVYSTVRYKVVLDSGVEQLVVGDDALRVTKQGMMHCSGFVVTKQLEQREDLQLLLMMVSTKVTPSRVMTRLQQISNQTG